ncbi:MAG: 4-hydroxy-3-methylbut-2-enyl diphosphate reductase [Promicromonosporaceae bacterium]|nr:4-hydroxy-3-methylbut-2-enyl diphosphate reductase [Promicromonosporaceae bacterium]
MTPPRKPATLTLVGTKRVLLAGPRGFCAGVDRAVTTVERALEQYGAPIYVRHEIVHNKHVVHRLRGLGAVFVDDVDDVPPGERVIFSAHGVSPAVREQAAARDLKTIDATCPLVAKVHKEAVRFAREGYDIILIGHRGHEEVEGTAGHAPDHVQIVSDFADIDAVIVRNPDKVAWLSQTTLSVEEAQQMVTRLRARFPNLVDPPSDDICYATQNRQDAVKAIAALSDVVIVVGSANSSNSNRLVEVALRNGARAAFRVDDDGELDPEWFLGVETVGVTSGASVPEKLVTATVARLGEFGFTDVEVVQTITETTRFALPRELRV